MSANRSIRSGKVTANSCATMPPKLNPANAVRSQPTSSSSAATSAATSDIAYGSVTGALRPMPR